MKHKPKNPNDIFHKPYYNPNYTNPKKKSPSDICHKPKKLYKVYKLYNAQQIF
jgi:hypothetical protein